MNCSGNQIDKALMEGKHKQPDKLIVCQK